MLPQIHFTFGATAFDRLYQFFLPLVPGAVLVGGLAIARPGLDLYVATITVPGPYIRLGMLAISAYVAGLILFGLSAIITGIASGIAGGIVFPRRKRGRDNLQLSQCANWRKVAAKFLGPELVPVPQQPPPASSLDEKVAAPFIAIKNTQQYDAQWKEWYDVLQDYLLRDIPLVSNDTAFLWVGLEATGWAIVGLSMTSPHARHWAFYTVASVFILFGALFPFVATFGYATSDRLTYWSFTARLLAEIRAQEAGQGSASTLSPVDGKKRGTT